VTVSPSVLNLTMERAQGVQFAEAVRTLAAATRAAGLTVPAFRSPPRRPGATRTIRRLPGGPVVAVRVHGRNAADVLSDLVEGVIVANALCADAADHVRAALLRALAPTQGLAA
jgi:hypothetical protein